MDSELIECDSCGSMSELDAEMIGKIMPILCIYNHEHLGNDDCDGRDVLCGYCQAQASRIVGVLLGTETSDPTDVEEKMVGAKRVE